MRFERRTPAALFAATFLVGAIPGRGAEARVGIGGAILFDIGFARPPVPQYVAERVGFGTGAWQDALRFAASEARRLGLLSGAQSSGGWSVSGGPKVRPEQAMKKLVWSETLVTKGRANYPATLRVPKEWLRGQRIELDLGEVGELARVRVNGMDLGVLWSPPFRLDITGALRPGRNRLEIVVTNYWVNRLIGDQQPGATRYTFAPITPYTADSPLRPSGLLTPVRVFGIAREER